MDNLIDLSETGPIEFSARQNEVIRILKTAKSEKYSLADWYSGAIYALKNAYNPDRFSQAAQSIRELLEKLPRVLRESECPASTIHFKSMRSKLFFQLRSDKERYGGKWKGKTIDTRLEKTILSIERYFELNQTPTRKEQIYNLMKKSDPMYDALGQGIRTEKLDRFNNIWKTFEGVAHHNTSVDEEFIFQQLALVEHLIIDLLAPITAQDQGSIREILTKGQLEQADIERLLELIVRRGANYEYFFRTVDNPIWISSLEERGFFRNPPKVEETPEGVVIAKNWGPIQYLNRVAPQVPQKVVEIIQSLEKINNPNILRELCSIACNLPDICHSILLKPLVEQYLKTSFRFWIEEDLIINILTKWGMGTEQSITAALEIIKYVIAFQPDPEKDNKWLRQKEDPNEWVNALEPLPRFDQYKYHQILLKGVRPLVEHMPFQIASILIKAVASMIQLGMHPDDFDKGSDQDDSEIWCRRLDKPGYDYLDEKENLVQTLTHACEQVYKNASESIEALDQALRNHRWKVFRRLRQHLYATHPNDQTLPWIREQILGHADFHKSKHHYEFQLMIRKACEHFGPLLFSERELKDILDAILGGPSKEDFRKWMGEQYSEEAFQQRQRYFHRMQLRPFATLLGGDLRQYFDELEGEASAEAVNDDSYSPYGGVTSGTVSYQSPKSIEDLEKFTDDELLVYLNDWNEEHQDKDNWLIEINISALAGVFQTLFKEKIVPDDKRLDFWLANRDRIARPVYVATMLKVMLELIKEKNFDKLDQWLEFCAWVLSHPDAARVEGQPEPRDESRDHPDWGSSRRAVVDFIETCVKKDTDAPITARDRLAALLRQACAQSDWSLDHEHPILLNRDDPITEAINNTRSRALESLVNFGLWIRRKLSEDQLSEVTDILGDRIAEDAKIPLTRPEQALLGMHFGNLCTLNRNWAAQQRKFFFPQTNEAVWRDAFGSYIVSVKLTPSVIDNAPVT